ncbi:N-acetylmuramoyl-L-alanine amidase [hydrothermal vent metagenome]|uniref:N-acetylmuramoyl-L-alanine amidase n=1 Tax=hydrothermal vent metagenome TaxID=652676 RepID=A0A1W1ED75_9ZZZZ
MKLLKLLLLLVLTSTALFSSVAILKKAELKNGELRLQFDSAYKKRDIKVRTYKNPTRKIFDIPNARLKNRQIDRKLKSVHCSSIRIAQYRKNVVRVVLEVDRSYDCQPYRPLFSYTSYNIPLPKFRSKKKSSYKKSTHVAVKKPKVKHVKKTYKKSEPFKLPVYKKGSSRERIVIDAGHGGHDSGAIGGSKKEKDLVLQISKRLKRHLEKRNFKVSMTRSDDRFLKLHQRTRIADKRDAKVFVSIHANSVPKKKRYKIQGVETFFLQNTRDAKSQRIAARENKAVLKGAGSKLSKKVIVDSVLNGPKIVQSNKLAIDVQRRIMTNVHKKYNDVKDGGVRHAPFWVLVGASRPSILVEVGYISHPKERKRLFNPAYQELIAKGIAEGIETYLNNRKKEIEF